MTTIKDYINDLAIAVQEASEDEEIDSEEKKARIEMAKEECQDNISKLLNKVMGYDY